MRRAASRVRGAPALALHVALTVALTTACAEAPRLTLDAPDGWRSAIIALETPRDRTVVAHEGPAPIELARDDVRELEVVAIFYDAPLAVLQVAPGLIDAAQATRALPPTALGGRVRVMTDGALGPAEPITLGDARAQRLRLPPIDGAACARAGQCLQIRLEERTCIAECDLPDLPEPEPPAPPAPPARPEAPAPLAFGSCPSGWSVDDDGCAPPPRPARLACAPHQAQHHGATACTPVGAPCPAGPWPAALPAGRSRVFVDPRGRPGPGGEPSSVSLDAALRSAPADAVLVLSAEAHAGGVVLGAGQALLGACAERTVIEASAVMGRATVRGGGALSDLTVRGPLDGAHAVVVEPGRTLVMRGVIVERQGVVAEGALDAEDLLVRGVGGAQPWGEARALWIIGDGSADVRRVVVEHRGTEAIIADGARARAVVRGLVVTATTAAALFATHDGTLVAEQAELVGTWVLTTRGGRVELADVALGTGPRAAPRPSILATEGSEVVGHAVVIDRPGTLAVEARDGARVTLSASWIGDGGPVDEDPLLLAHEGGALSLERTTVRGFDRVGVRVLGAGTTAALSDVRVLDTRHAGDGRGVSVEAGAHLEANRLAVRGVRRAALDLREAGTATVSALAVDGVALDGAGGQGVGIAVESGAHLVLRAARVVGAQGAGLRAEGATTRAEVYDLEVARAGGNGLSVRGGAALTLARAHLAAVRGRGLAMSEASVVRAQDLVVRGVQPVESESVRAVEVLSRAQLELARAAVEDLPGRGLTVQSGARARIEDLTVGEVREPEPGSEGQAMVVRDPSTTATITRALFHACVGGGPQAVVGGAMRLVDATVDNSALPDDASARQVNRAGVAASVARVSGLRLRVVGSVGFAVAITASSTADLAQVSIDGRRRNAGISVIEASRLVLTDAAVRDVLGCGLCVRELAEIRGTRVEVLGVTEGARELGHGALIGDAGDLFLVDSVLGEAQGAGLRLFGNPSLVRIAPYVSMKRGALVRSSAAVSSILEESERGNIELEDVLSIGNGQDFGP